MERVELLPKVFDRGLEALDLLRDLTQLRDPARVFIGTPAIDGTQRLRDRLGSVRVCHRDSQAGLLPPGAAYQHPDRLHQPPDTRALPTG